MSRRRCTGWLLLVATGCVVASIGVTYWTWRKGAAARIAEALIEGRRDDAAALLRRSVSDGK